MSTRRGKSKNVGFCFRRPSYSLGRDSMIARIGYKLYVAVPHSARMLGLFGLLLAHAEAADELQFNRDIRPLLSENCYPCHGPDSNRRKAELRLDHRDLAIAAGAFVPG